MKKRSTWIALGLVAALSLAAYKLVGPVKPPPGVRLSDLAGLDQLSTRFNEAKGSPRMILVLSPT